jgi:serine/threonine-protein kinase RsbW
MRALARRPPTDPMAATRLRKNGPERPDERAVLLPVHPTAIAQARRTIAGAARAAGLDADRVDDLVVAVSEACTNALEAQQRVDVTTPIEVTYRCTHGMFEVTVADHGAGFRPEDIPPRPHHADPGHLDVERGWGIQLMRELVDEITYCFTEPGTALHLRCRLPTRD